MILRLVIARVRALFRRDAIADEIREELQFHLDMRTEELAKAGLDARAARAAARKRFGNPAVVHDAGYDVRGGGLAETVAQDVRYGLRQLARQPSFSIAATLTLALCIGLSTALFSVMDVALLRPLPYRDPDELVTILVEVRRPHGESFRYAPSMADIRAWRRLDSIVAHAGMGRVNGTVPLIVDPGTPQRLIVAEASEDFLETYGIHPILGRGIQAGDTRDGAPRVALLGHAFWQREFGGDAHVLGRVLRVQNQPVTVVGVLPAGFFSNTPIWLPIQFSRERLENRGSGTPVIARLRPGVTLAQARTALGVVAPPTRVGSATVPVRVEIDTMYHDETGAFGTPLQTLSLAVAVILVIGCMNVAGLLLARGATRDVELAIRASIGAGRARLVRQLLTEGALLALAGAVVGVLIAFVSLDALVALVPMSLPPNSPPAINWTVLACTLGVTMITALLFGLAPALVLSRATRTITSVLSLGGRGAARLPKRTGQWLIAGEVSLALVLMAASGLMLRSFSRLMAQDLGFDAANVVTLEVEPLDRSATLRRQYYASLLETLRRVPELQSVGAIDPLSLTGGGKYNFPGADTGVTAEGFERTVVPGYFEAMGVRAVGGRLLEDGDRAAGQAVVVNAAAAQAYFGGNAVGHTLNTPVYDGFPDVRPRHWRVVGVVRDIRHGGPQAWVGPEFYVLPDPHSTDAEPLTLTLVLRLRSGASLPPERLKRLAESLGPRVLVGQPRRPSDLLWEQVSRPRQRMLLITMLGVFGLGLTIVGIFSVTAYSVARRRQEIGVRVALGARPVQLIVAMVADAAWPVTVGLGVGLVATYYGTRFVESFLFDTPAHDAGTLAAVVALLGIAASVAAWLPARRATRVDPLTALRTE